MHQEKNEESQDIAFLKLTLDFLGKMKGEEEQNVSINTFLEKKIHFE